VTVQTPGVVLFSCIARLQPPGGPQPLGVEPKAADESPLVPITTLLPDGELVATKANERSMSQAVIVPTLLVVNSKEALPQQPAVKRSEFNS
jgi:hypothetical protein